MTNFPDADVTDVDLAFVRRAIAIAVAAVKEGNRPFGAVLVAADGTVVAEDCDRTNLSGDPLSHGETNVIRAGLQRYGLDRMTGASLYVSGEPCSMCAGTILRSGISRVIYGAPGTVTGPYITRGKQPAGRRYPSGPILALAGDTLTVVSGVLLDEAMEPLELYAQSANA